MTRTEYRRARRLLRDNGQYALRWLPLEHAAIMRRLMFSKTRDELAERAFVRDFERKAALARDAARALKAG